MEPETNEKGLTQSDAVRNTSEKGVFGLSLVASRWSFLNNFFQRGLAFITFFVLARLLFPEDFGTLSLILILPNFLDFLTSLSFENALVRHKEDTYPYLDAVWTLNILRGVGIAVIVFFSAPYIASFFNIEGALEAIRLSGLLVFIQNLSNVGQLFFIRELDFKKVLYRDMMTKVTYSVATILFALALHSYWALFWGAILQAVAGTIATFILHPYRPRLRFNFKILKELLDYSFWVYGQNLLGQALGNLEDLLLGKFVGANGLGLYGKAKSLAGGPITPISSMISKISFPAFARIQDAKEKVADGIHKSFDIVLAVSLPFLGVVLLGGHKIVLILLGERWIEVVPIFQLFTVGIAINVVASLVNPLFNALGIPKTSFKLDILYTSLFVVLLFLLTPKFGVIGASWSFIISSSVVAVATLVCAERLVFIDLKRILSSGVTIALAAGLTAFLGSLFLKTAFFNNNYGFAVIVSGLGILYCGLIILLGKYFNKGPFETIWEAARELFVRERKFLQKS